VGGCGRVRRRRVQRRDARTAATDEVARGGAPRRVRYRARALARPAGTRPDVLAAPRARDEAARAGRRVRLDLHRRLPSGEPSAPDVGGHCRVRAAHDQGTDAARSAREGAARPTPGRPDPLRLPSRSRQARGARDRRERSGRRAGNVCVGDRRRVGATDHRPSQRPKPQAAARRPLGEVVCAADVDESAIRRLGLLQPATPRSTPRSVPTRVGVDRDCRAGDHRARDIRPCAGAARSAPQRARGRRPAPLPPQGPARLRRLRPPHPRHSDAREARVPLRRTRPPGGWRRGAVSPPRACRRARGGCRLGSARAGAARPRRAARQGQGITPGPR